VAVARARTAPALLLAMALAGCGRSAPAGDSASVQHGPAAGIGARDVPAPDSSARGDADTLRFAGEVGRGERYERRVFDGLRFRLVPISTRADADGWSITLIAEDSTHDFIGIATPPYHGVNEREIAAWHFRNADNTAPNTGDVNAPQEERGFNFVTNARDYDACARALDIVLWPNGRAQVTVDSASAALDEVPRGEGRLMIHDMKLGGLGAGLDPWIESMRFEVSLTLPSPARTR
jgi:hypothetical protein